MGELGQLLRATREEKGLTPEDAEAQTRIRAKFIHALEEARYDELPTPGHVSGFLRNYALYLGLDVGEVRALYEEETSGRGLFDPGIFHPKDIDLAPRRPLFKASLVLGLVIAAVILVVGGWAFWQYGLPNVQPLLRLLTSLVSATGAPAGEAQALAPTATEASPTRPNLTRAAATRQQATSTAAPPTATSLPPTETPTPTQVAPTATATRDQPLLLPTATPAPTETPAPTPTRAGGVVLEIKVVERSWMQATVDGVEQPGELLEAGEERTWKGQYAIYFICGNAGGVEATVNGEELGVLGGRAEVVEKTWTLEGEVTPTPAAQATPAATATPASSP